MGVDNVKLQILMSTYNGEEYLAEQLDSLLAQTIIKKAGYEIEILVRDDGSKDGTWDILREYAGKEDCIRVFKEENVGVIESFFRLIDLSEDADYLAFCDQDDVWMPEKLERALGKMSERAPDGKKPLLYCGRPLLTDAGLRPIKTVWPEEKLRPSFGNALIENICVGCTCVMNRPLIDIFRKGHPSYTSMHDRWFYLVASCFGEVIYDTEPFICYRQHGENVVGMKKNRFQEFRERLGSYRKKRGVTARQAASFLEFCSSHRLELPAPQRTLAEDAAHMDKHLKIRFRFLRNKAVYRQRKGDDLLYKFLILFGAV